MDIGTPDGAMAFYDTPFPLKLSKFKYDTTRRNIRYTGSVQLTSVSRQVEGKISEFNGKFSDVSVNGSYGCTGRFRIVEFTASPTGSRYTVVWFVDGRVKGKTCPVVGRTIEVRELQVLGE